MAIEVTNWKTRLIVGGLIAAPITLVVTWLGWWLQQRSPMLVFEASGSQQVMQQSGPARMYLVRIENSGNKEAEDVICTVKVPNGHIQTPHIEKPRSMEASSSVEDDILTLKFKGINPSETVNVSILATGKESLLPYAEVSLRAKGVTGNPKQTTSSTPTAFAGIGTWLNTILIMALIPCAGGLYSLVNWIFERFKEWASLVQVEIKIIDDNLLKVRMLKGIWQPKDWINLRNDEIHGPTKKRGSHFREYGNGKHVVQIGY